MESKGIVADQKPDHTEETNQSSKSGSGNKKVPQGNRLYQPTASSVAKNKRVGAGRGARILDPGMKPPLPTVKRGNKPPGVDKTVTGRPPGTVRGRRRPESVAEKTVTKRDKTPETTRKAPTRGSSTPTEEKPSDTILDAWDASQIPSVNRTQLDLNETTALDPCQALQFLDMNGAGGGGKTNASKPSLNTTMKKPMPRTAMKRPLTTAKAKRILSTAVKGDSAGTTVLEDPEFISDEQMDLAYCRYIQSEYIKMTSEKALNRTQKECEGKMLSVWRLLEQSRQEVLRSEEELLITNIVSEMQDVLGSLGSRLGMECQSSRGETDLIDSLSSTQQRLLHLSNGLEDVKHNIEVRGIVVESEDRSKLVDHILNLLKTFNGDRPDYGQLFTPEMQEKMKVLEQYCAECEDVVRNTEDCSLLVKTCQRLAVLEASLKFSFESLKSCKQTLADQVSAEGNEEAVVLQC